MASVIASQICRTDDVAAIGAAGCSGFGGDDVPKGDGEGFGGAFRERVGGVKEEIWTEGDELPPPPSTTGCPYHRAVISLIVTEPHVLQIWMEGEQICRPIYGVCRQGREGWRRLGATEEDDKMGGPGEPAV